MVRRTVCRIVSIVMLLILPAAVVLFLRTLADHGGDGFLDLTNVVQYFLIGIAAFSGIVFAVTARFGRKS